MESEDSDDKLSPTLSKMGTRLGKKDFSEQTQCIVMNVYRFFQRLADNPLAAKDINFNQVQKLTAEACGISRTSVQSIKKKNKASDDEEVPNFDPPRVHYKRNGLRSSDPDSGHSQASCPSTVKRADPLGSSPETIQQVQETFTRSPQESTNQPNQELQMSQSTIWSNLRKRVQLKLEADPCEAETVTEKSIEGDEHTAQVLDIMKEDKLESDSMEEQLVYPSRVRIKVEKISVEDGYAEEGKGLLETGREDFSYGDASMEDYVGYPLEVNIKVEEEPVEHEAVEEDKGFPEQNTESPIRLAESRRLRVPIGLKVHDWALMGKKQYKCKWCKKEFLHGGNLKVHERLHLGEKPFQCDVCSRKFTQKATLKRHVMIHTGEKPFQCKLCKKTFIQSINLKKHEREHTGEDRVKCKRCNKEFSRGSYLREHGRVHTGERPFKCRFCQKGFTWSSALKVHERIHTGVKPFKCKLCDKGFTQSCALKNHERVHTKENRA